MSTHIDRTPHRLRVRCSPSPAWPIGIAFFGLLFFWLVSTWYTVDLTRAPDGAVTARVQRHRIGSTTPAPPVHNLRAAELREVLTPTRRRGFSTAPAGSLDTPPGVHVTVQSGRPMTSTFQVVLVDRAGQVHPLQEESHSNTRDEKMLVQRINAFINDPAASRATARLPWNPLSLVVPLTILLLVGSIVASRSECRIDTASRTVHFTPNALGLGTRSVSIDDIVEFRPVVRRSRHRRGPATIPVALLGSGGEIPLATAWAGNEDDTQSAINALERCRESLRQGLLRPQGSATPTATAIHLATSRSAPAQEGKICQYCGLDCSDSPRVRDALGRYAHQSCHDAQAQAQAQGPTHTHP